MYITVFHSKPPVFPSSSSSQFFKQTMQWLF